MDYRHRGLHARYSNRKYKKYQIQEEISHQKFYTLYFAPQLATETIAYEPHTQESLTEKKIIFNNLWTSTDLCYRGIPYVSEMFLKNAV